MTVKKFCVGGQEGLGVYSSWQKVIEQSDVVIFYLNDNGFFFFFSMNLNLRKISLFFLLSWFFFKNKNYQSFFCLEDIFVGFDLSNKPILVDCNSCYLDNSYCKITIEGFFPVVKNCFKG